MEDNGERTCCDGFKKQFRLANLWPTGEKKHLFVDSQWSSGRLHVTYVIYRIAVATLLVAWVAADFCVDAGTVFSSNSAIWLIFATNWSFLALVSSGVAMAMTSTYHLVLVTCLRRDERELRMQTMGTGLSLQWVLYNVASNSSIGVSVFYWVFVTLFDGTDPGFLLTPTSELKHSINSVYVIADVSAVPIRALHFVYPVASGAIYALFSAVYFAVGGVGPHGHPYAYPILDWGARPATAAVTCSVAVAMSVFAQGLLYGLYRIRILIYRKSLPCGRREEEEGQFEAGLPSKDGGHEEAEEEEVVDDEDTGLFASSASGLPDYRSVDCMELRRAQTLRD